jgi:hypothetical protein
MIDLYHAYNGRRASSPRIPACRSPSGRCRPDWSQAAPLRAISAGKGFGPHRSAW